MSKQEDVYKHVYCSMGKFKVCPQQPIDFEYLAKKIDYFGEAVNVVDALGLRHLMTRQCDYNIHLVQQFYSTVEFDGTMNIGMTWMSGSHRLESNFREFAEVLGYPFLGSSLSTGERMHEGPEADKNKLVNLYGKKGVVGTNIGLYALYDILLRMFRLSISPSAGNNDAIRGGLINLMFHAYDSFSHGNGKPERWKTDVMDYLYHEIYAAVRDKKVPMYGGC